MATLYTIGYGGRTPTEVLDLLKQHEVQVLVDVRAFPRSRIPGFGKSDLARLLPAENMLYRHVEELGNANRKAGPTAPARLIDESVGLSVLLDILSRHEVSIMCAERDYKHCHRSYIASRVIETNSDIRVVHITG